MAHNFTNNEMCDMVFLYVICGRRLRETARAYARRYPERRQPHHTFFLRLESRLRKNGQFRPVKPAGRPPRINTARILEEVTNDPEISTRDVARYQGVSQATVCRALKSAHFHPYKVTLTQELYANDKPRRLRYCQWLLNVSEENYYFSKYILFSDECIFHNDGKVNRHNSHYWATENPHWMQQAHTQVRWSVNVWAGILGDHIIGPHFIDDRIDGDRYRRFLNNELVDLLDEVPLELRANMWFQQDGHPAHTARATRALLNEKFGNRWIGLYGPHEWPPRSPDLTPLDFFLWGHLKQQVYATRPANAQDLRDRI
ncbi:histone-lysine N-methyltransferase SETMAR-like, partial [Temnothorax nylanderi]|uniref:histone-lysine N-methyltransferase SETMAR-like n=1 Tax=Temnothorax nylanderi TaxID=102681 RepID=UPI003A890274